MYNMSRQTLSTQLGVNHSVNLPLVKKTTNREQQTCYIMNRGLRCALSENLPS